MLSEAKYLWLLLCRAVEEIIRILRFAQSDKEEIATNLNRLATHRAYRGASQRYDAVGP